MFGETVHGRAEFRAFTESFLRALPDVRFDGIGAPYLATDGNGLAVSWRMTGTFTGELDWWGKRFGANPPAFRSNRPPRGPRRGRSVRVA